MTKGNILKLVVSLAWPFLLANIGQQLYMIVDGSVVGRGIGVKALAAVGSSDWIYWLILWSVMGLTQGFSFFVSRYFGRKDYRMMNKVIAQAVILSIAAGVIFTLAGLLIAKPVLTVLATPDDILEDAWTYLVTMIAGTLVVAGYNLSASILRAFGNGRGPLIAIIIAGLTNVVLDLLFVMVFHLGIIGAAAASVAAQFLSLLFCLFQIRRIDLVDIRKGDWRFDVALSKKMLAFSLPIVGEYMAISLSGIILQSTVNAQGSIFVAGFTASNKLYGLMEVAALSIGMAFSTFFSQNYGAGNYDRLKEGVSKGRVIVAVLAGIVSGIVITGGRLLLQIFIDLNQEGGPETMEIAYRYLFLMATSIIFVYLIYVFRPALQSVGVTLWVMYSGFAESIIRIIMAKAGVALFGVTALFFAEPASWTGSLLLCLIPYYYYEKKLLSGVKENSDV